VPIRWLERDKIRSRLAPRATSSCTDCNGPSAVFLESNLFKEFVRRLQVRVEGTPAHLLCEEDMRAALRDALLELDEVYRDPRRFLREGPNRTDVVLWFDGTRYLVELKLWHSTLKPCETSLSARIRSASSGGFAPHLRDLVKLATAEDDSDPVRLFVELTQQDEHPLPQSGRSGTGAAWGPFDRCVRQPETTPERIYRAIYELREGETTEIPPDDYGPRRVLPTAARVIARRDDEWKSGGGTDWGCRFRFRVLEVLRPGVDLHDEIRGRLDPTRPDL
jgi:hypothetical protein